MIIEVWRNHPESPPKLIESWELSPEGKAVLTYSKYGQPLYYAFGSVGPDDGEKFLNRLIQTINNSSFMKIIYRMRPDDDLNE